MTTEPKPQRVRRYDPCTGDCYGVKRNDADGELMLFEEHVDELAAEATDHERTRGLLAEARAETAKAWREVDCGGEGGCELLGPMPCRAHAIDIIARARIQERHTKGTK